MIALYLNLRMGLCIIGIVGVGGFLIPVIPLSFELACELSFPVGEAIAAGMLMTGG